MVLFCLSMKREQIIEAVLFASSGPVALKRLAQHFDCSIKEVRDMVEVMMVEKNVEDSTLHLVLHDDRAELVVNPALAPLLPEQKKPPLSTQLTQPQLETLSIVAYKGPVSKAEIEHVRGINCSVILRSLLMRGLIEEVKRSHDVLPGYQLTHEALAYMGIHSLKELPNYEAHAGEKRIEELIDALEYVK